MDRFFTKLQPDKMVLRNNYFFQVVHENAEGLKQVDPLELSWATSALGPEDAYVHGGGHDAHSEGEHKEPQSKLNRQPKPEEIYSRTERQSLRRMPRTGAILFTIRTYLEPVTELAKEPGVPGRMASAIRSWPEDVALYKGRARYQDVLLEYLDRMHDQQVAEGIDESSTRYPF